jgi:hypothetical protein
MAVGQLGGELLERDRMGRNPATGEAIEIKVSKKIAFQPAKELKEAVCACWPVAIAATFVRGMGSVGS